MTIIIQNSVHADPRLDPVMDYLHMCFVCATRLHLCSSRLCFGEQKTSFKDTMNVDLKKKKEKIISFSVHVNSGFEISKVMVKVKKGDLCACD